jgi:hypothetical protein
LGRLGFSYSGTDTSKVDIKAVLSWLAGIAIYQLCMQLNAPWGYAIPSLLATLLLGWLTRPVNAKASIA